MSFALRISLSIACAGAFAACTPDAEVEVRALTVHTPRSCAVADGSYAQFYAFGDFPDAPALQGKLLNDVGAALDALPKATRQLELDLSAQNEFRFRGFSLVAPRGPIDVLAWPDGRACALTGEIGRGRTGHQLTVTGPHALVSGGSQQGSEPVSFVADLRTGRVEAIVADDLRTQRARASAVAFPGGVLVSGGQRSGDGSLVDSAERLTISETRKGFDLAIPLGTPRADHASILLASGEVLLIGGTGPRDLIDSLEIVDVAAGRTRTAALARLAAARRSPRAIRLANGEILVAGGFDNAGAPVRTIEWLTPDATAAVRPPRDVDVGDSQGMVALPAGGALIVTTLRVTATFPRPGASVIVVSATGELLTAGEISGNVSHIALFETFGGAPILWTGERWLRWQPWLGSFGVVSIESPGPAADAALGVGDPGLPLWTDRGRLVGARASATGTGAGDIRIRGPYTSEVRPLLNDEPGPIVPDGLISPTIVTGLRFDRDFGLTLPERASVFLADATFAAFEASFALREGQAPLFVLREDTGKETELGGALCPAPAGQRITLQRKGPRMAIANEKGETASCEVPGLTGRIRLGLRGRREDISVVRDLSIKRSS